MPVSVCRSVGLSVSRSVGLSVRRSVCQSVSLCLVGLFANQSYASRRKN